MRVETEPNRTRERTKRRVTIICVAGSDPVSEHKKVFIARLVFHGAVRPQNTLLFVGNVNAHDYHGLWGMSLIIHRDRCWNSSGEARAASTFPFTLFLTPAKNKVRAHTSVNFPTE